MSLDLEKYAGSGEFPLVDAGDYEVVLKIERRYTKDGTKDFANCDFMIRSDVEQPFQGAHIFDKAWRDASNPEWFDLKKLGSMLVTQKNREDYKTSFDEVDECIQFLNGATMIIHVDKKYDDYYQKEINELKYLSYKPSLAAPYTKPEKEATPEGVKEAKNLPDIKDNDIPF